MKNLFVINMKSTHYVLGVGDDGLLYHIHHGKKARDYEIENYHEVNSNYSRLDCATLEYTAFGGTMYRNSAIKCEYFDKCRDTVLKYKSHRESDFSLEVTLTDEIYDFDVVLTYRFSEKSDILTRFVTVINNSNNSINLEKLASAEISLPNHEGYDVTNFNGAWGAEFLLETTKLKTGTLVFDSKKGNAGHTVSPMVIMSQNATEDYGDVFFACLGYGGNFKIEVECDFSSKTRAVIGMNDFDYLHVLKPGESFTTPKVYLGYSNGFTQMTHEMNKFAVENILPKQFAKAPLPVLYNSWEATGFNVNTEHQLKLAKIAKEIGCELFVMDDGWFGERKNDWAGLGDWSVNKEKFPNGIDELIDGVNALGMDFGLWFEPEMVNEDSNLYRAHPDWIYHYPHREKSTLRHQLVLNLTRDDVKKYVFDVMDKMLSRHNIRYIKWDMNRPFSEIGTKNLENGKDLWHRHTMAVYEIADKLKEKYPYLQIEACASGGGRAEYGALEHFDMVWTSDNTDPFDRLQIQRGFSMLYPTKSMRAWVTEWNENTRPASLDYRFNVSMQGSLSVGSNLLKYTEKDVEKAKKYIAIYKEFRQTIQFGALYRLKNDDENGFYANQYVSDDKSESILFICGNANSIFNKKFKSIKLKGLDENSDYDIFVDDKIFRKSGAHLMNVDKEIEISHPFFSKIIILKKSVDN